MPATPGGPRVYVDHLSSGVRPVIAVPTSVTAFVGRARRGAISEPVTVESFADFVRHFGGLWELSTMSYAVQHFFMNGGLKAIIVRVVEGTATRATLPLAAGAATLTLQAASEGAWGNELWASVDYDAEDPLDPARFNLTIYDGLNPTTGQAAATETFPHLSCGPQSERFVAVVLERESQLVRVLAGSPMPVDRLDATAPVKVAAANRGNDGADIGDPDIVGNRGTNTGLFALEDAHHFNVLCIPPPTHGVDVAPITWQAALAYCEERRAILILDAPAAWKRPEDVLDSTAGVDTLVGRHPNAAIYFPRIRLQDPLTGGRVDSFAPCGAVAGIYARTDATRGVWKAAAGREAAIAGVQGLTCELTNDEIERLNRAGVNCLRTFPHIGCVVWGARTLHAADDVTSEWKYLPVRRLALFLEDTLDQSTKWVVFEPNDEPTWAQIRLSIDDFLFSLWRQGALQGSRPRDAYWVKCDRQTTTQSDVNSGVVNILVGFAPLKPAEFVIISIQRTAGRIDG